jgi:toxin FitB
MSGYLLDTNCISEVLKPKPDPLVLKWFDEADESTLYLSVLTLGEIRNGVAALPESKRKLNLEAWIEFDLRARFAGKILPIDEPIAELWGAMAAEAKRRGKPMAVIDGLIAATAIHYNLTVVSRNATDFPPAKVFNPWKR